MTRTLKHHVEEMCEVHLDCSSPILTWAVQNSGQLLARFQRAVSDGKTPYERRKGKPYKRALPPFAECVMYMTAGDCQASTWAW